MDGANSIPFRARKRRGGEGLATKPPSERIAKRHHVAAGQKVAAGASAHPRAAPTPAPSEGGPPGARGAGTPSEARGRDEGQPEWAADGTGQGSSWLEDARSAGVGLGIPRSRLKGPEGPREHAGNSLVALRESGVRAEREVWEVKATSFELHTPKHIPRQRAIGGGKPGLLVLPPLEVRPSSIPHGGLGVFAVKDIKKGTWLTEYGGEIIDVEEARQRRDYGDDTHIRSCGMMDRCIDARVRLGWDVDYYVKHHMVGGFFNDAHGTGKPINSQYVTTEMRLGYQHPYDSAPWVSKRVFLRATRDIKAGDELLVTYGTTYHAIHFSDSSTHGATTTSSAAASSAAAASASSSASSAASSASTASSVTSRSASP